ncbi:hypothetical protein SAMN06265182_2068 [Persephonella hydrogeniphila]|uniref:Peptidase propeptide and YPEB domain-containing protein n=1 Tax=Persephonella hydrogeniphila TaxID=198703 RepID=A0A285NU90_9AQUI|nr:hypothetical protein [Persephonella hydrogeniphila]SNZ11456.1 hypothetical protein SAMN06265182_2068 [Persephonella hydrogeniphila]
MRKLLLFVLILVPALSFSFPFDHMNQGGQLPIGEDKQSEETLGCIGDCSACHLLTPIEAESILKTKFDVKKVLKIAIKNGYFEVEYENSKGEKEKINLLFSKDKACKEIINLNE